MEKGKQKTPLRELHSVVFSFRIIHSIPYYAFSIPAIPIAPGPP